MLCTFNFKIRSELKRNFFSNLYIWAFKDYQEKIVFDVWWRLEMFVSLLVSKLFDYLINWLFGASIYRIVDSIDWLIDRLIDWLEKLRAGGTLRLPVTALRPVSLVPTSQGRHFSTKIFFFLKKLVFFWINFFFPKKYFCFVLNPLLFCFFRT